MTWKSFAFAAALAGALVGCRDGRSEKSAHPVAEEGWSVTAWGEHFEIFPEVGLLVTGKTSESHTHVTRLRDFLPVTEGSVAVVLRDAAGKESVFEQTKAKRPGIFGVEITPPAEGEYALLFRIRSGGVAEEIPAGRVRAGSQTKGGGLIEPPKPPNGSTVPGDEEGSSFLKEQQWKTEFATAWSRQESLRATVIGSARVVPPAGGEVIVTAPIDSVVALAPWPFPGQAVEPGAKIFRFLSRATAGRSLSELEAELTAIEADLATAKARSERLAGLLLVEATSRAEVERAKSTELALEAKRGAFRKDLDHARGGGDSTGGVAISAPWRGRIAEIFVTPGQALSAGDRVARIVKTRPLWLELALRPGDADRVQGKPLGVTIRRSGGAELIVLSPAAVRVVSRVPILDAATASVRLLLEIDETAERLPIGSAVEVELALSDERSGVVLPLGALIDDSGATIVYEQLSGESFARRPVRVVAREGDRVMVEGLAAGVRVVTKGGGAVRRSTLLGSGAPEGHVH